MNAFEFVSTQAVNPYTWGFTDGLRVTSELVRVAFAFVNGSYLALSGLRPAENIEVELTHGIFKPKHVWSGRTQAPSPSFVNISAVERGSRVELRPSESKFALINASMLLSSDDVALAAEIAAYAASDGDLVANNSSGVLLDIFIGYTQVSHRYQYDSYETFPLTWNRTSRRYELLRYLILPFQCVLAIAKYIKYFARLNLLTFCVFFSVLIVF